MGISILELVLRRLRDAGFIADVAFPGQKFPPITEPVAAVHIEKVDRANLTVTVEVSIICPAAMGGAYCEVEALRATEVLRWEGAGCIQHGCEYDGLAQLYVVSILATFTCITEAQDCIMGPGFQVFQDDRLLEFIVSFQAEQVLDHAVCYEMGEDAPIGIGNGSWYWKFRIEELFPAGSEETYHPEEAFTLRIETPTGNEVYRQCRWTSVRREFSREGLRRIRSGICVAREEDVVD